MLKFYAKSNKLVRVPGAMPSIGQADMYVGRTFDPTTRGYPAHEHPYEVAEESKAALRLIKLIQRESSLWPADEYTAEYCNVDFVPVEFSAGVFVEKKTKPSVVKPES